MRNLSSHIKSRMVDKLIQKYKLWLCSQIKIRFGRFQSPNCVIRHISIRQHHLSWPKAQANWHSHGACSGKLWSRAPPYRCDGACRSANVSVYLHANVCMHVWPMELQRETLQKNRGAGSSILSEIKAELLALMIWCKQLARCHRHWPG